MTIQEDIHEFAKRWDITHMTIRANPDESPTYDDGRDVFEYIYVGPDEYQFFRQGNVPTNYITVPDHS